MTQQPSQTRTPEPETTPRPAADPSPRSSGPDAVASAPAPVDLTQPTAVVTGFGRIPVTDVQPVVESGVYPAKAVVGELVPIRATVFREGHDAVNASVIVTSPSGVERRIDMTCTEPGIDAWEAGVRFDADGDWTFRIEGWSDPWGTWKHNAEAKLPANVDLDLVCLEGRDLLERTAQDADAAGDPVQASILRATAQLLIPERPAEDLLDVATASGLAKAMAQYGPREMVTPTRDFPVQVDRRTALFASWYEFFPRSVGATRDPETGTWTSGTFDTSLARLDDIAAMGFDVVYLPPIHPIGSAFKKGPNNTLDATEDDPGSPWAIGSPAGGHDAIHPDLGDFEAFDRFVARTRELGMEVALDFALQASPDHPWVTEHPEWFTTRLDGTIAYAENPPKKYQDIYPINFDNDPDGIYHEVLRILKLWISHGVKIFRVDNPHTKPLRFWDWLATELRRHDPDVLLFAEAFTRPPMMHGLGKVGFHLSYTYFTWRNTKAELTEYLTELSTEMDAFYRPNFFVNTPDINPFYLQSGKPAAFAIRAMLAATLSPAWGVYSGFELFEHEALAPGREEYLNSEKYEYRPRDYTATPNLNMLMGSLNAVRRAHPALQQLRHIDFHPTTHSQVIAYTKVDGDDKILVVCSLDPDNTVEAEVTVEREALGLEPGAPLALRDELTGQSFTWTGAHHFVRLTTGTPAHIFAVA